MTNKTEFKEYKLSDEDRAALAGLAESTLNSRALAHIDLRTRVETALEAAFLLGGVAPKRALSDERRDAERYRFLRAEHERLDPVVRCSVKMLRIRQSPNWGNVADAAELDTILDEEMAK